MPGAEAKPGFHREWIGRIARNVRSIGNGSLYSARKSGSIVDGRREVARESVSIPNGKTKPVGYAASIANGTRDLIGKPVPSRMEAGTRTGNGLPFRMEAGNRGGVFRRIPAHIPNEATGSELSSDTDVVTTSRVQRSTPETPYRVPHPRGRKAGKRGSSHFCLLYTSPSPRD